MCAHGISVPVEVTIPAHLSHDGKAYQRVVGVDACIAPIVQALNAAGLPTIASCCCHGAAPSRISLRDGRDVLIVTYDQAQRIQWMYPAIDGRRGSILGPLRALVAAIRAELWRRWRLTFTKGVTPL